MKLKTKIIHSFDIESDSLDNMEFDVDFKKSEMKKKKKIIEVKNTKKIKNDSSTRLF